MKRTILLTAFFLGVLAGITLFTAFQPTGASVAGTCYVDNEPCVCDNEMCQCGNQTIPTAYCKNLNTAPRVPQP